MIKTITFKAIALCFMALVFLSYTSFGHAKSEQINASSDINGVKTIIIEPSKNNKSNRGRWLQISEVVATETGSQKDLAHIANNAITESSSTYSKQSHSNNAISGVGPDRYPNIFHSGSGDKAPNLKIILNQPSELDSITIFGRADSNSRRDIYDITLRDEHGKVILKQVGLNATSSSHAVKVDFTDSSLRTIAVMDEPLKSQNTQSKRKKVVANSDTPFAGGQVWKGWYDCGEGKTKLKLTITEANSDNSARSKQSILAIYDFTTLKGVNGAFNTRGVYRPRDKVAIFAPVSWIKQPPGYRSPKFHGTVSSDNKKFTGKILWRGCSNFELHSPETNALVKPKQTNSPSKTPIEKSKVTKQTRLSPYEMSKQYGLAQNALNSGDPATAKNIFNEILRHNPDPIMANGVKKQLAGIEQKQRILENINKEGTKKSSTSQSDNKKTNAAFRFEQNKPPAYGSHSISMYFESPRNVALVADNLDKIVKEDLVKRSKIGRTTNRIQGQYHFFVNGNEIEWRRYDYRSHKGWKIVGNALNSGSSIINQSANYLNSPEALVNIFSVGFSEKGSIPATYTFKETRKGPSNSEKWYGKRQVIVKGVSYNIEVEVDDFNTLITDRDSLVKFAKLDLQKRVGGEKYGQISASYWFKSHPDNKRYLTVGLRKSSAVTHTLDVLYLLANGDQKGFRQRYNMSKEMFIAAQNGNKKQLKALKEERIAEVESTSNSSSAELKIAASLNDLQKLPVLYMNESRKWNKVGGFTSQEVARKALEKYGFPMNTALSPEQITLKRRELADLITGLEKKGAQFKKSAPKGKNGYPSMSSAQQKQLTEQVLYPNIMNIQSKAIDLLSQIPRTEKGLDVAYEVNGWLSNRETQYQSYWNSLITSKSRTRGGNKSPNALCEKISTAQQVALGKKTGRCFFEFTYSFRLLRDVWRLQYMRNIDNLISKKIENNGADLYRKAFLLAYGISGENFDYYAQSNFTKWKASPGKSSQHCIFENCSSKLSKIFASENSGKPLSKNRKKQYLSILEKKSIELRNKWNSSRGQSKLERYSIKSDIIDYSREVAKNTLLKLSNSAAKELGKIQSDDQKGYREWNKKIAKRIRLQLITWRKLWDIGFGIQSKDNAALGLPTFTSSYLNARHSGGSPFNGIAEILYDAQYQWVTKSEKGTSADANTSFPSSWSSSGSYQQPKRATKHYGMLLTPSELFFESIEQQVGQASSALASYASMIAELDRKIKKSRKEYFDCLPSCRNLAVKEALYSRALIEKDIYYLQLSGQSGSLADEGHKRITTAIEGISGGNGFTLVDDGIPKICIGYFNNWLTKVGKTHGRDGKQEIDAIFGAAIEFTKGNFSTLKEAGFKMVQIQQEAFAKSAVEYRKYQICRDQYEFDKYE